jgi:WD40 repeat protein
MILLEGRKQKIAALAFSPEGNHLAVAGTASHVQLWDLTKRKARPILGPNGPHRAVYFLDERRVLTVTPKEVRIAWTNQPLMAFNRDEERYFTLGCPTPDGGILLGSYAELMYRDANFHIRWTHSPIWVQCIVLLDPPFAGICDHSKIYQLDLRTGNTHVLSEHSPATTALAVDPSRKYLAVAAGTHLKLIPLANPSEAKRIRNNGRKYFTDVAFHPSGQYLLVSCNDSTVRLHDMDLHEVAAYDWEIGAIGRVAFSPDGMRAAAGNKTGTAVIWDFDY